MIRERSSHFLGAILFVVAFAVTGCGYFFGSKSETRPIEIGDDGKGCIKNIGSRIQSWSQSSQPSIAASIDCVIEAVDQFDAKTEGRRRDSWTKAEIANFVTTYFDQNRDSFDTWMNELLHLKQAFIGGENDRISRLEVVRIRSLLTNLKPALEDVGPFLPIVLMQVKAADPEAVDAAAKAVSRVARILYYELKKSEGGRPPVSTLTFADSLARLGVGADVLDRFRPLAEAGKAVAVGGDKAMILDSEWSRFAEAVGEAWAVSIRFRYDVVKRDDFLGQGLPGLSAAVYQGLGLLESSVKAQKNESGISRERIRDLVYALEGLELLPFGITAKTLDEALPNILAKIFYGNRRGSSAKMRTGFGEEHFQTFRKAVVEWLTVQRDIVYAFSLKESLTAEELIAHLKALGGKELSQSHRQMIELLESGRPLLMDKGDKLRVATARNSRPFVLKDLNVLNASRAAISFMFRGFIQDPKAAAEMAGVTEAELEDLYIDTKYLGAEIGLIDLRSVGPAPRTFMEASLFTSVGDGGERLSLKEAVEWFHIVYSSSIIATRMYNSMVDECGVGEEPDIFGKRKLRVDCFRENFVSNFTDALSGLPGFVDWYMSDRELPGMVQAALELAGRGSGISQLPIDYSEFRGLFPILYYTESLMVRHDANNNEILDTEEIWNAFPIIRPFIRRMGNGQAETLSRQQAIYSWLIRYGAPPDASTWDGAFLLAYEKTREYYPGETATRLDIIEVISGFAVSGRNRRTQSLRAYFEERAGRLQRDFVDNKKEVMLRWAELFYCMPQAAPLLRETVVANPKIFLSDSKWRSLSADQFIDRVKSLMYSIEKFDRYCMHF